MYFGPAYGMLTSSFIIKERPLQIFHLFEP